MDENNTNQEQESNTSVSPAKTEADDTDQISPDSSFEAADSKVISEATKVNTTVSGSESKLSSLLGSKLTWVLVVVIVLLAAAGVYAYVQYNQPQNRMKRAFASLIQQDQAAADYSAKINASSEGVDMTLSGEVHAGNKGVYSSYGIDSFEAGALALSSGFKPKLELIVMPAEDKETFLDAFVKLSGIDESAVTQFSSGLGAQAQAVEQIYDDYHNRWVDVSGQLNQNLEDDPDRKTEFTLTDEDKEKLTDIIKNGSLVILEEELESKEVAGSSADGFVVEPDFDGLIKIVREIEKAELDIVAEINKLEDSDIDFDKIVDSLQESKEEYQEFEGEFELQLWLDGDQLNQLVVNSAVDETDLALTVTRAEFDGHLINAPDGAIPFADLADDFEAIFGNDLELQSLDSDNDSLPTSLQ